MPVFPPASRGAIAMVAGIMAVAAPAAFGQDAATNAAAGTQAVRWTAEVAAGATDAGTAGDWKDGSLALRRRSAAGTIGLEWLWASRFGRTDRAVAIDAYANLSPRAYVNLRYQDAPGGDGASPGLFPRRAWRVEGFQVLDGGWELSAGYDRLEFAADAVGITGVGVGRYRGNFYARVRVARASGSSDSTSVRGLLRYYYAGTGDEYVEFAGGSGRSATELAQLGGDARFRSDSASVAWLSSLGPAWSLRLGASYADDQGAGRIERGASVAIQRHW